MVRTLSAAGRLATRETACDAGVSIWIVLTGAYTPAGTKRAGQNLIGGLGDVIGYSDQILLADFDYPDPNATGKNIALDLEYCAAHGHRQRERPQRAAISGQASD